MSTLALQTRFENPINASAWEEAIALALCSDAPSPNRGDCTCTRKKRGHDQGIAASCDAGVLLPFSEMTPRSAYLSGFDPERLYGNHADYLLAHPAEVCGDETEVAIVLPEDADFGMRWIGMRKLAKLPRRVAIFGRPSHVYEMHFRETPRTGGTTNYVKRVVAFSKAGGFLPVKVEGRILGGEAEYRQAMIALSLKEDHFRKNVMRASVADSVELMFPVPIDDYQKVFSEREGPFTSGGRRKQIVHWVAQHLRRSPSLGAAPVQVAAHVRGVREFAVDGLRVRIDP